MIELKAMRLGLRMSVGGLAWPPSLLPADDTSRFVEGKICPPPAQTRTMTGGRAPDPVWRYAKANPDKSDEEELE